MDILKEVSKKVRINLASLKGLGETLKKIEYYRNKLIECVDCANIQFQEIETEIKGKIEETLLNK